MRSKRLSELKQEARGAAGAAGAWRAVPVSGWAQPGGRRGRRAATTVTGAGATSNRQAFVELAPLGLVGSGPGPVPMDVSHRTGTCCLVVETVGARLSVEFDDADPALVEAVCRLVLSGRMHIGGATT